MKPSLSASDDIAQGPWVQSIRLAFAFLFVAVGLLAVAWLLSNVASIPADGRGAVLRFGKLERVQGAGLILAWPRPFETIVRLPSAERSLELPISRLDAPVPRRDETVQAFPISTDPRANIAFFLTGDAGLVHLSARAYYRVTDPAAYLVAKDSLDAILQGVVIAGAVRMAAGRDLDGILVTGPQAAPSASRDQLRADLLHEANRRLADLAQAGIGIGIEITRIDLGANLPSIAKAAFDQVLVAGQDADATVAEARTEADQWRQTADQSRDKMRDSAEAIARETLARAHTRTAEISALAGEPAAGPILDRLYFDRIGAIIAKAHRVDTFDAAGAARLILPGGGP